MKRTFTVLPPERDLPLADLIARRTGVSPQAAQARILEGGVAVNGRRVRTLDAPIEVGARVVVHSEIAAVGQVEIVFRDRWIAIAEKPAGMATTATRQSSAAALDAQITAMLGQAESGPTPLTTPARALHRLDREASGLVLLALSHEVFAPLTERFRSHAIVREYTALVSGRLPTGAGVWDAPVAGKSARTHYRVLASPSADETAWGGGVQTALALELETGRTHQIRVHARQAGHPLVGDGRYGGPPAPRLMLHAHRLCLQHPKTEIPLDFTSPVPW
jgi:23S rRNA pseudouridine1911/1915/1917 synthase